MIIKAVAAKRTFLKTRRPSAATEQIYIALASVFNPFAVQTIVNN